MTSLPCERETFATSLALVLDQVQHTLELRRSSRAKLVQFAIDVCLVAHGVRTGYLVDAIFPSNPKRTLSTLLNALREKGSVFKHVVWWHHGPTAQSFLAHIPLLQDKLTAVLDETGACVFVKLNKHLSVARAPPGGLQGVLHDMKCLMFEFPDALVLTLSDSLTQDVLIPLAAVMIDYPVAYVPAHPEQTQFLEGATLDIYSICFQGIAPSGSAMVEHLLLRFSCPQVLASNHAELSPGALVQNLRAKFAAPLERIGMRVLATHHTESMDRVAL